ncbi:hypothetical protein, partial [Thioalkalivibrio sp.]|uniref:hypothetical protein n=1 Tax=Thioalkalivibrio sp. TaxID=2093813 RepID=UPI003974B81C
LRKRDQRALAANPFSVRFPHRFPVDRAGTRLAVSGMGSNAGSFSDIALSLLRMALPSAGLRSFAKLHPDSNEHT